MSLNAAAITELTSESAVFAILNEWLSNYFDGGDHAVGNAGTVTFPKVNRAFNQSAPAQPLHTFAAGDLDAEIRVVLLPRSEAADTADTVLYSGKLVTSYVLINFWVSAKKPGKGQSEYLAEQVAQLLKALLTNPDTRYDLAEKGITHLRPQPISPVPNTDYHQRLLSCSAQLQYPVEFGGNVVTPPDPNEQSVGYFHEEPLLAGNYLLGEYRWQAAVTLRSAKIIGWAPQVDPVTVALEVDGVVNPQTLTLPTGPENQEVSDSADLGVDINAGQFVRWKIISAPVAADSAWHVAVTMQVKPR